MVETSLERIQARPNLNCWLEVWADEALEQARKLDEERKPDSVLPPLYGVVAGIKDVLCYAGHRVSASSKMLEGYESPFHATAVERLLDAGAIILGRLNCDEFAMGSSNEHSAYGKVLNGLDENRVPGGSSGGSAVAVQDGHCMISLGSDTGGSVRQPADFCGVVGLKPGYGRVSRYGLIAYASSFDQIGIFSRNLEDAATVLQVIAGADSYDSTVSFSEVPDYLEAFQAIPDKKIRIAYFRETVEHEALDPEIRKAMENVIRELKKDTRFEVNALSLPLINLVVPTYYVLTTAEASSNLSRYDGVRYGHRSKKSSADLTDFYESNRTEGFGMEVKRRIMLGTFVLSSGFYDAYFTKAQQIRELLNLQTQEVFSTHEAILMPTVPEVAFCFGEKAEDPISMYLADIFTVYANLVGISGISLPLFSHSNGMPFGLQVMTNRNEELSLLQISNLITRTLQR